MTGVGAQGFQELFPVISVDAAREASGRLMKIIERTPVGTSTSERIRIFRGEIVDSALRGETWAIEIGESERWLVRVDSDFRIEGLCD